MHAYVLKSGKHTFWDNLHQARDIMKDLFVSSYPENFLYFPLPTEV